MKLRYFLHEDRIRKLDLFKLKNSRLKEILPRYTTTLCKCIDDTKKAETDYSQNCPVLG